MLYLLVDVSSLRQEQMVIRPVRVRTELYIGCRVCCFTASPLNRVKSDALKNAPFNRPGIIFEARPMCTVPHFVTGKTQNAKLCTWVSSQVQLLKCEQTPMLCHRLLLYAYK